MDGICKGSVEHKLTELRQGHNVNTTDVIVYADKTNTRLGRRCYKFIRHDNKRNVVAAKASEWACFVWGMMTDNIVIQIV